MDSGQYQLTLGFDSDTRDVLLYLDMLTIKEMADMGEDDEELKVRIPLDALYRIVPTH